MRKLAVIALAAAALLGITSVGESGAPRADLTASAASEPPRRLNPGESFRASFTVLNEGRATAGASVVRLYLSSDQQRGNDTLLTGQQSISSLRIGRSATRSRLFIVPAGVARGLYFLLVCVDDARRVRESDENNCRASSQKFGVSTSERGPVGLNGANGPAGASVTTGLDLRRIARTQLELGRSTVDLNQFDDAQSARWNGGNNGYSNEGSTQTRDLVRVGPVRLQALCRKTTNGDAGFDPDGGGGQPPNTGNPNDPPDSRNDGLGMGQQDAVEYFDEDGDEAKILVYADDGTLNFRGQTGLRMNVPAGTGTPGKDDVSGGEGKHQVVAVMRDPDPGTNTRNDGSADDSSTPDGTANPPDDREWLYAFRSVSATIVHSSGTQFIFTGWAGIDVLGVDDKCSFGGVVEVIA